MTVQEVREAFEKKRSELVRIGTAYGIKHPDVLRCSQELDLIHNRIVELSYKGGSRCNSIKH